MFDFLRRRPSLTDLFDQTKIGTLIKKLDMDEEHKKTLKNKVKENMAGYYPVLLAMDQKIPKDILESIVKEGMTAEQFKKQVELFKIVSSMGDYMDEEKKR